MQIPYRKAEKAMEIAFQFKNSGLINFTPTSITMNKWEVTSLYKPCQVGAALKIAV